MEDGVSVHVQEVEEVRPIAACRRVDRPVGIRQGIQERVHAPLHESGERLLQRIAAGAAQNGVLGDVGDPGVVPGRSCKTEREQVFRVRGGDMEYLALRGRVPQVKRAGAVLGKLATRKHTVGADGITGRHGCSNIRTLPRHVYSRQQISFCLSRAGAHAILTA